MSYQGSKIFEFLADSAGIPIDQVGVCLLNF